MKWIRCSNVRIPVIPTLASTFVRGLTTQETSAALRPFYFAVHPDLFGRHPQERAVNDDNLKRLNAYLAGIHSNGRSKPTVLRFFVRQTSSSVRPREDNRIREVRVSLLSNCPHETVLTVLRSCNLSVDHVSKSKTQSSTTPDGRLRTVIKWDKTFYDHYNIPNPYAEHRKRTPEVTLSSFLRKNIKKARKNQEAGQAVKGQIRRLQEDVRKVTGMTHVLWDSHWGPVQFRACLLSFLRLMEQYKDEIHFPGSTDTIVFGKETGFSLRGHVILQSDEVPTQWHNFLRSVEKSGPMLERMKWLERRLSSSLNGIRIQRPAQHRAILLQDYVSRLDRMYTDLEDYFLGNPEISFDQDLSMIHLVMDIVPGRIMVSPDGEILVPSSCPAFLLIDFLLKNAALARETRLKQEERKGKRCELMTEVTSELELHSLTQEDNITWEQMTECCHHLLKDPLNIGVSLTGCRLSVAQFYSVMSDGLICIPWNWKGVND